MASAGSDRNWKGMFIATIVILAVFGLIFLSVLWLTPSEKTGIVGDTISFDDFLNRRLLGESFNGTWITGNVISHIFYIKMLLLAKHNILRHNKHAINIYIKSTRSCV